MSKFTIRVEVTEHTKMEPQKTCRCYGACSHAQTPAGEKKANTIVNLTLQADTLNGAIDKAMRHLGAEKEEISVVDIHEAGSEIPVRSYPTRPIRDDPQA